MQTIFLILCAFTYPIVSHIDLPQSYIVISDVGYYFSPEQNAEWLNDMIISSFQECIHQCNQDPLCRTFDYNLNPNQCRLFQVEPSPGQILYEPSLKSQLGYVQLFSDLFSAFNQTCDQCTEERYLICYQNSCQCPSNTFWDGSICQKQKYAGRLCSNNDECVSYTYNLTCVSSNVCTSAGYPTNICALNKTVILFNYTINVSLLYTRHSVNFTAVTTAITITFSLKDQTASWLLDSISLIDVKSSTQLIKNGDFETGSLADWNYCNPNWTNNSSKVGHNGSFPAQSGQYFYFGAPYPYSDFLSQTILTTIGDLYTLSFWLGQTGSSVNNAFIVTAFS